MRRKATTSMLYDYLFTLKPVLLQFFMFNLCLYVYIHPSVYLSIISDDTRGENEMRP